MKGCPNQATWFTFQDQTVNCRFIAFCDRYHLSHDCQPKDIPDYVMADIRQAVRRQSKCGRVTLLSGSKIYWFARDRCLHPFELLLTLGWDESDLNLKNIDLPVMRPAPAALGDGAATGKECVGAPPSKRRRVRRGAGSETYNVKATELAGNGMCIPDVQALFECNIWTGDNDLFLNAMPQDFSFKHVRASTVLKSAGLVILDPTADFAQLQNSIEQEDASA